MAYKKINKQKGENDVYLKRFVTFLLIIMLFVLTPQNFAKAGIAGKAIT